ncbi:IS110 family transposase [Reyranella sp.]|uniref:IS110 family transposase n=1 Tax=Reyranella sp. TaxID=1929291 RepID=UPI003784D4D4
MAKIARIGVDTSKSVFQVHGVDEAERVVLRRKVRRAQFLAFFATLEPTVVGLEACGASYHWARELRKLGHEVVLIPPQYVKAYVARGKNDAKDAEAICEAMSRPRVRKRFVAVKSEEQSAAQMLLGIRESVMKRRTQLSNTIRSHAAEFGLVVPKGLDKIEGLLGQLAEDRSVPDLAKEMFDVLGQEFAELAPRLATIERRLKAWHRADELSRRLVEVPTIGPIGACRLAIRTTDPKAFASGRMFAAWIGLTPKDHSTAGKQKLGGITRAGDESLRAILVAGATSYIEHVMKGRIQPSPWLADLLRRKPRKLVAVALANKTARIAWRLMVSGQRYDPNHVPAKRPATLTRGEPIAIAA